MSLYFGFDDCVKEHFYLWVVKSGIKLPWLLITTREAVALHIRTVIGEQITI